MTETLKPCPFCGKPPKMETTKPSPTFGFVDVIIECNCRAAPQVSVSGYPEQAKTEATAVWNRRPTPETKHRDGAPEGHVWVTERKDWLTRERVKTIAATGFDRPFGRDSFMPDDLQALCRMALHALDHSGEGFSFEDAKRMVRGAVEVYGGGYSGAERDAFANGIKTALNVLESAKRGDTQTAANLALGTLPPAPHTEEE